MKKITLASLVTASAIIAAALFMCSDNASAYTTAQINTRLNGGTSMAARWDDSCKTAISQYPNLNFTASGGLRNNINGTYNTSNGGASYRKGVWISQANTPSVVTPLTIQAGAGAQTLQLNYAFFLCAPMVEPDLSNNCQNKSVTGRDLLQRSPWVTNTNANDHRPNSTSNACQGPAQTFEGFQISTPIRVVDNDTNQLVATISSVNGKRATMTRDDNSRYWFSAPLQFSFAPSGGKFTKSLNLRFEGSSKEMRGYSKYYTCPVGSPENWQQMGSLTDYGRCWSEQFTYYMTINVLDYGLTPTISNVPAAVTAGSGFSVGGSVRKTGGSNATADWNIARIVFPPNANVTNVGASKDGSAICQSKTYTNGSSACSIVSNNKNVLFNNGTAKTATANEQSDYPVGTRLCYVASVNKYDIGHMNDTNAWAHSARSCTIVGKQPKLQVNGGDASVASDTDTSVAMLSGTSYGSWVEYGAFINGVNTNGNFGSGASLRNGTTTGAGAQRNQLTFANTSNTFGKFGGPTTGQSTLDSAVLGLLPRVGSVTNGSYDVASLASGRYDSTAGTFSLHGSNIRNSVVINAPNATITIDGNLQYAAGIPTSADAIPQLIVIAKNITIAPSVSRVDGWLLAKTSLGTLTTCNGYTKSSTNKASLLSACNTPLTVNGPVTAKNGDFYRAAGSDDKNSQKNSAETFNLPADSYVWQYRQASKTVVPTTVQVTELPVRY